MTVFYRITNRVSLYGQQPCQGAGGASILGSIGEPRRELKLVITSGA